MNLSCLPVSLFARLIDGEMSVAEWARYAVELGLDGIDLSVLFFPNRDSGELAQARREIESAGTRVAVMNTYPDLTHPNREERERQLDELRANIAMAADLGARMVRVTAGQAHPETARREGVSWAVDGLTQAVEVAEKHGVTLAYENHSKPGVWDYPDFSYPADVFLEIAEALKGTEVKILFDTANPVTRNEDPLALLEKVIDRTVCVHAADTGTRGKMDWVTVGTGVVPFDRIFSMLKCAGYDGWISIEEASFRGRHGVAEAVRFVREAWDVDV